MRLQSRLAEERWREIENEREVEGERETERERQSRVPVLCIPCALHTLWRVDAAPCSSARSAPRNFGLDWSGQPIDALTQLNV